MPVEVAGGAAELRAALAAAARAGHAVLVDFYATWCGPCQMAAQALDALGPAFSGRCLFVRIDTEKYPRLASAYGVQALPTLVLFRDNAPAARLDGFLPEPELRRWLEGALAAR